MDVSTFLIECLMCDIKLNADGEKLQVEHTGRLKPATADFIRQHKQEIISKLSEQEHGACVGCGKDTESMLTAPGEPWCWMCCACFDIRGSLRN